MRDYDIFEHDEAIWKEYFSAGFWRWFDQIGGAMDWIDLVVGELQLLTDSRSTKRQRRRQSGRVRFILPRTAVYTHGVNQNDVTRLLKKYGIRTRRYMFDHRNTYFDVRSSQANWAITVIERWKAGQLGKSWKEQAADRRPPSLLDKLFGGFAL